MPAETHMEHSPITRGEILELVREHLSDIVQVDPAEINEQDGFLADLQADSLAIIDLVEALEEELAERTVGFEIEDEEIQELKTVKDAVDYVESRVGTQS